MSTFTTTQSTVRFTDTDDGAVSFTATRPAVTFTAAYQSVTGGGGASDLDDLTDVTITAAALGEGLRYNGTAWVDYPMSARWADADFAGAFGPGFDILVPGGTFDAQAAGGGPLTWGPDYVLIESPDGVVSTVQVSEGETVNCTSYLPGDFSDGSAQEGLWTLTGGVFVRDTDQPLQGEHVGVTPTADLWTIGLQFAKMADGRMEVPNLQYLRRLVGQSTVVYEFSATGTVETTTGAAIGVALGDATAGAITLTLEPVALVPGRSILFVKTDSSGNAVSIDADGTETINGSTSAVTLTSQWEWVRLTCDRTGWIATRAGSADAHIADTSGAHAASAISVGTLNGNLSAVSGTDVEQALQAVDNLSLGGTVDVVSNVAQDRILGRTASGSGDSEELTAASVRTFLGVSIEPKRRIPLTAGYSGLTGMYGAPPWEIFGNITANNYTTGTMRGGFCNIGGAPTLGTICFEVSTSALTAGQSIIISCYALDATTGMPTGTPVWSHTVVVGTTTGVYEVATTNALPAAGCFLTLLNPSGNAGTVGVYSYQPTGPYLAATRAVTTRSALLASSLASAPDLTSYKIGSGAGPSVYGYEQNAPLLLLR